MLRGGYGVLAIADGGGQVGVHNPLDPGRNDWPARQIGPEKLDTGVHRGRIDRQVHGPACVQANAAATDSSLDGILVRLYLMCHSDILTRAK